MTDFYGVMSAINVFINNHMFEIAMFLWRSSVIILSTWGICFILFSRSPRTRRLLWTATLLLLPFLPLISTTMNAIDPLNINVNLEVFEFSRDSSAINTENSSVSETTSSTNEKTDSFASTVTQTLMYNIYSVLFMIYFFGFSFMFGCYIIRIFRVYRWKIRGMPVKDSHVSEHLETYLGPQRNIMVYQSEDVPVPMVVGVFSPTILLPSTLVKSFDNKTLEVVLAHECAHIRRKDNLVLLYASFLQTILFIQPLFWLALYQLAHAMEESADYEVIDRTDIKARRYATILFGMAAANLAPSTSLPFSRNHKLLARVTSILDFTNTSQEVSKMNKVKKCLFLTAICTILVASQIMNINCGSKTAHSSSDSFSADDDIEMIVYGKVVDPDGNPVSDVIIDAIREIPSNNLGNSLTGDTRFSVKTDNDGNYRIAFNSIDRGGRHQTVPFLVRGKAKHDGGIVLTAHPGNTVTYDENHKWFSDLANSISKPVKLTNGTVGPVNIKLSRGGAISGTVYDRNNEPASGQTVRIAYENGQYNRYLRPVTATDKNGRFTITNIRPGKITVIASEYYAIFEGKSPFPEKHAISLRISENSNIDNLTLNCMSIEEIKELFKSVDNKRLEKAITLP